MPPSSPSSESSPSNYSYLVPKARRSSRKREQDAQEMARLLDPSYQGSSLHLSRKEGNRRSLEVYVDRDGDLHDPDFRYFPVAETFVSQSRRENESRRSLGSGAGPIVSSARRRSYWDQDNDQPFLSDEEEEEEFLARELGSTDFLTLAGHGNGTSASESTAMRSRRTRRNGSFSSYSLGFSSGYPSSANTHSISFNSPSMTISTLPTSYESENTLLSSELDGEKDKGLLKRRRRSEKEHFGVLETTREESEGILSKPPVSRQVEEELVELADFVPTCTETLKRHWLSFSLKFRLGLYRSKRRFIARVNSLL